MLLPLALCALLFTNLADGYGLGGGLGSASSSFCGTPPSFLPPPPLPPSDPSPLVARVSRRGSKQRGNDFSVSKTNAERIASAGRPGQKNFVDPTKLFVGNLDFRVTGEDLAAFFKARGMANQVHDVKVISDWKSGASKGYGFALFTDPMFATAAMSTLRNEKLMGRVVRLSQGKKKLLAETDAPTIIITKDKRPVSELAPDEAAIRAAITEVDDAEVFDELDEEDGDVDGVLEEEVPPFAGFGALVDADAKTDAERLAKEALALKAEGGGEGAGGGGGGGGKKQENKEIMDKVAGATAKGEAKGEGKGEEAYWKLTVVKLKEELKAREMKIPKGKKEDLVAALVAADAAF
ncbi:hypothetical protein TeGR_g11093 [Tetraparma gracilis]|uniref:RRM domain-containing protein n=1 Tax=Tetraparma gracilis TaxID=2962635 RepID=A0ABQ6N3W5_9STRA|nr:hypothetical protein TeGR_g11093 [Tetraparma gracilis]